MKKIEQILETFFDYNRFVRDEEIETLTENAEKNVLQELSEDEISMVSAAGEPAINSSPLINQNEK